MTGTASHFRKITAIIVIPASKYLLQLFLKVKSLNFKLIIGNEETIKKESNKISPYKNHLLSKRFINHALSECQYNRGKEATKIPTAGTGSPLKEKDVLLSRLNLAKRYAAAHGNKKEISNHNIGMSIPPSSCAKLNRRNW